MATRKSTHKATRSSRGPQGVDARVLDPWIKDPLVVRRFIEQHPHYEHLCNEVSYALTKLLSSNSIKVAAITARAKTLESFLEKIERKTYADSFEQITDFAGARVVCYYPDDIPKVENLVRHEFEVIEKQDKSQDRDVDRFGYSATHFLVRLGERASGARYDDLKGKLCEIQVRTVMQDAWAIFSHHLMYKHESDVPDSLRREIHALAGTLATADVAFQAIRDKRDAYIRSVAASSSAHKLGSVRVNLDSVAEFLTAKFSPRSVNNIEALGYWVPILLGKGHVSLRDVESVLDRTARARSWYEQRVPVANNDPVYELGRAILIAHDDTRDVVAVDPEHKILLGEAALMIEKGA